MANLANIKKSVDLQKAGTTGTTLKTAKPVSSGRAALDAQAKQNVATVAKPKPTTNTATNLARGEAEFDRTKPSSTIYNPYQALQEQKPGSAPVSPYVGTDTEVKPEIPPAIPSPDVTGAVPAAGVTDYKSKAEADLTPGFEQWEKDHGPLFDMADELKDEKITSYEELYDRQLGRLDELQAMMEELTSQRNSLVAGSANVQQAEINAAYDANAENLRIAKERLDETQRKVLAEREKQLARKTVNEENMLAVIGGFGSMAGNKMLIDSVNEGEESMATLKTEFSLQDQEHSAKVVKLNNDYKNDKLKIEQWKQEKIMENYESLQSYIADIIDREDMADVDKVKAINSAKDQYNNTISELHSNVIDARFELSREIISRADTLRKEAEEKVLQEREITRENIEYARADLAMLAENYALDNFSSLPADVKQKFDEIEKAADLPPGFTQAAIENFKTQNAGKNMQIRFETDNNGNLTVIGVNKSTGLVEATSQVLGAGKTTSNQSTNPIEKAFNVGSIGGWCGDYASTVSTASQVGDTWESKLSKVTHRDNPTPGDKLVIPLGVTDSGTDHGHVAVVLGFNPETGIIKTTESNKDGRQSRGEGQGIITFGEYNINDLKTQYGDNWGFIKGELKGDYAKQAEKLGLTSGASDSYGDMFEETTPATAPTTPAPANTPAEYDYESEFSDFE